MNGDICDGSISEDADLTEANPMHPFSVAKVQEVTYDGDPNSATNGVDRECNFTVVGIGSKLIIH